MLGRALSAPVSPGGKEEEEERGEASPPRGPCGCRVSFCSALSPRDHRGCPQPRGCHRVCGEKAKFVRRHQGEKCCRVPGAHRGGPRVCVGPLARRRLGVCGVGTGMGTGTGT